jgi:hypothetical protein
MKSLKILSDDMSYGDSVRRISKLNGVGLTEARSILSSMTFGDYQAMAEANITPPSGSTIGPSSGSTNSRMSPNSPPSGSPASNIKSMWPGAGAPVEVGMTVGFKGLDGRSVPGSVSQVDMNAKGVKVNNPATGQEEWRNMDDLEQFQTSDQQSGNIQPGQQMTAEQKDIKRMRQLAGITETCSAGATGAGSIAVAPVAMGNIQKRQPTEEALKKEYNKSGPTKTIVGDTKSHQASGELSSTLAANGKKTANRKNNGLRK